MTRRTALLTLVIVAVGAASANVDEPGEDDTVLTGLRREYLNHLPDQSGAVSLSCGNDPPEAFRFVWMESNRAANVV